MSPSPARQRFPIRPRRGLARLLALLASIVLAVLLFHVADRTHRQRQLGGPLVDEVSEAHHSLGNFELGWSGGVLTVRAEPDGRILWSSVPGRAFVGAATGDAEVHESRGLFRFRDRPLRPCLRQVVEEVCSPDEEGSLRENGKESWGLRGQLHCADGPSVPWALRFTALAADRLRFELEVAGPRPDRLYLTYASEADERIYGLGEQFTHFDAKGRRVPITVMEQGIGRGAQPLTLGADLAAGAGGSWHTTYAGVPHYLGSHGRSLLLENHERSIFDFRRDTTIQVQVWSPRMVGQILAGSTPAEQVRAHTEFAGRMRPLPEWVHEGAIVGIQGGTEEVRRVLGLLDAHGVPVSALWLQDWVGRRQTSFGQQLWWNWTLDENHYPGWHDLVDELAGRGIRILSYVNPFLADLSERDGAVEQGEAVPGAGATTRNLYAEARDRGFLVKTPEGEPYRILNTSFSAGLVDLSHAGARAWLKEVLHEAVLGRGVAGWMADFGEALPWDGVLASGEPASRWHNRYPEAWARLNREVIEESGRGDELLFFTRSAYTRSPRYTTLMWLGDQVVGWDRHDGLRSALTGLLSGGISGFALNHSDIGGYTTIRHPVLDYRRSEELLLRWMEHAAFTAVFRSHEGNRPSMNVQPWSNETTLGHFAHCARLYRAWAPYRRQLVQEAATTGLPVARHLVLHHPDDPVVRRLPADQYLLGTDLLVAPVLDPGVDRRRVYLPNGPSGELPVEAWIHLWTGEEHPGGGWVEVPAPLGQPPVFYRRGTDAAAGLLALLDS